MRAAQVQHDMVIWVRERSRFSGAQLARRYEVSTSTWSRMTLGERWAGQLLLSALIEGSLAARQQRPGSRIGASGRRRRRGPTKVARR